MCDFCSLWAVKFPNVAAGHGFEISGIGQILKYFIKMYPAALMFIGPCIVILLL